MGDTVYGYCPYCKAKVRDRKRGVGGPDTCTNGHVYPSGLTVGPAVAEWITDARSTFEAVEAYLRQTLAGVRTASASVYGRDTVTEMENVVTALMERCRQVRGALGNPGGRPACETPPS